MEKILERINKAALDFLEPLTLHEINMTIVQHGKKLFDAKYGSIFVIDKGKLTRSYASAAFLYKIKNRDNGFIRTAIKKKKVMILPIEKIRKIHPLLSKKNIQTVVVVPLMHKQKIIGVLTFQSLNKLNVPVHEVEIFKLFGSMASSAILQTKTHEQTKMAVQSRDNFISVAAHELRTPLTTLYGYMQLLEKKLKSSSPTTREWLRLSILESNKLTYLINELLDTSKIQTGSLKYSWKEYSLRSIVKKALKYFHTAEDTKRMILLDKLDGQDCIVADQDKLHSALINIVENALKFSSSSSKVKVRLELKKNYYYIFVQDKGIGIKKIDIDRFLERHYKLSDTVHEGTGMGLGLFIARHIIDAHQGTLLINSSSSTGTLVTIKLPAHQSHVIH